MSTSSPEFSPTDIVQRVNQPESIGVVRESRWDEQAESWNYLVQFGAQLKALPQEVLQKVTLVATPWDALKERSFSGISHFVYTLTYHRLKRPPTRIANSFATARTEFYPHQFKPLLKFLDHPGKRLLIADDVGLGKTIEAGYILRELEAQQVVEKVLILVPAKLAPKWKRELQSRFEEMFEIVRGSALRSLADRLRKGQELDPFRWIVSYESARPEDVRQALEETQPQIDILIADEAHKMRNSESLQHKVGSVLCRCADSVVFLSATPVQNSLEDLWHLLRLLSPEEFADWTLFQDQIQANRFLLACQQAFAQKPPNLGEAKSNLNEFLASRAGKHLASTEFSQSVLERVGQSNLQRHDVVELQADLARLSPIGHVLSRTRKAEAIANRSRRSAGWKSVRLTPEERRFYDRVEKLCSLSWPGDVDSWGFRMSLIMAYRITASCIPAAINYFATRLGVDQSAIAQIIEEESTGEFTNDTAPPLTSWPSVARDRLTEIVSHFQLPLEKDSKLEILVAAINEMWNEDDEAKRTRRKLVIFSYFPRTVEYLAEALRDRAINARLIHGGISIEDREIAIDDFLQRSDVPVLLTSDVGGEGIDLQRASVLVNYDLPWNPMVVEQRIGRIDRIGQEAEVLNIINLVVEDSVEERVLAKLLKKIQIFRESIGELDPIIGEEIERLTAQAIRGELSEDELLRVVNEKGDALERRVLEARRVLSRVDSLLAADQGLIDEINAITGERQLPTANELLQFLNTFLAGKVVGCQIPRKAITDVVSVDFGGELKGEMERETLTLGPEIGRFTRRVASGPIQLTLSREVGYRHSRVELVHLRHPLVSYAVQEISRSDQPRNAAFSLKLGRSAKLRSGLYCFLIALLDIRGIRSSIKLIAAFNEITNQQVWIDPDYTIPIVLEILEKGEAADPPNIDEAKVEGARNILLDSVNRHVAEISAREQRLDHVRIEQQRAAVKATFELRFQRAEERLRTLEERHSSEFPIRMARANVEKAKVEFEGFNASDFKSAWTGIDREELAVGFLRVGK